MPPSKTTSTPRRTYLNSDDLLIRLICLPEREQQSVLNTLAAAVETAETRVIAREATLYDAQLRQAALSD